MSDTQLAKTISDLPIQELRTIQRHCGRLALPAKTTKFWRKQHELARSILRDDGRGPRVKRLAELLFNITYSISTVAPEEKPNYYQYTDVHLLDWYLAANIATVRDLRARAVLGIYYTMRDLVTFESNSLANVEKNSQLRLSAALIHKRMSEISSVFPACEELAAGMNCDICKWDIDLVHHQSIANYVDEPHHLGALVHFSCFPLTQSHDEIVFIRTLHASELCFYGIRVSLIAAIEALKGGDRATALRELQYAGAFAHILHLTLMVLRTMPPEHFADFRDYTGKASALQSKAYHELDIYLHGVTVTKQEHFAKISYLNTLLRYSHPRFVSLKDAVALVKQDEWSDVIEAARALDKQLLTWRGLHLGFARRYLPQGAPGTGGTSGADYLARYLHGGVFEDTTPDWDVVRNLFPEIDQVPTPRSRIASHRGIAPRISADPEPAHDTDQEVTANDEQT